MQVNALEARFGKRGALASPNCRGPARSTSRRKRHPIPTAIIRFGIALWTLSAVRDRARGNRFASLTSPLRELSLSIVDFATKVFRERAQAKARICRRGPGASRSGSGKIVRRDRKPARQRYRSCPRWNRSPAAYRVRDLDCAGVCARRPVVQTLTIGRNQARSFGGSSRSNCSARASAPGSSP